MKELKKKFGIKGIPSYLILNKQGEQIYFKTGFDGRAIEQKLTEGLES
jgi:thioredoxin-related protein